MRTQMMRNVSYLLPDPGGEVVRSCLDEIERLRDAQRQLTELREAVRKYFALREIKRMKYIDDMTSTEYTAYYEQLSAARAAVDALIEDKENALNKTQVENKTVNNVMVYLNGKNKPAFRCHCGCNVFHKKLNSTEEAKTTYICNACDTAYIGE
jgi:PHP family Zn ribbon phosphoesterase